jgi:NitT/TauT family transport system substrate-binding protein
MAEELLLLEGFSQIEYVEIDLLATQDLLTSDRADISVHAAPSFLPMAVEQHKPIVVLAGIHGGCYELFAHQNIRAIRDLKGKRVAIEKVGGSDDFYYIASILAYVGIDPNKDINWVETKTFSGPMELFIEGKVDAFLGFPPQPQELRMKKIGHVILNTGQDRPWQQYYCCMISARQSFVRENPVAAKRAVRAILKSADICATDPSRVAKYIVGKGYEPRYQVALDVVQSLSYARWRTYNPEDSLRFYGVRLHETGLLKSEPQKLIAQGTDWRFLNELKRELKA